MKVFYNLPHRVWTIYFAISVAFCLLAIASTDKSQVLIYDASTYFRLASTNSPLGLVLKTDFVDIGYPFILSTIMAIFGKTNIIAFQVANFLFWFVSSGLIFASLGHLTTKKIAFLGGLMMVLSPIFTSFSAKLYSEPFACLGVALIIYGCVGQFLYRNWISLGMLSIGMVIFFFTKSVYAPLAVYIFVILASNKHKVATFFLVVVTFIVLIRLLLSLTGGRNEYNLAIQVSKINQPNNVVFACGVYQLSYPLGKYLFADIEGYCWQNTEDKSIPGYSQNAYVMAHDLIANNFTLSKWLSLVFDNPLKYLGVMLASMLGLVFIEGYYSNFTQLSGFWPAVVCFALVKLFFSVYLWRGTFVTLKYIITKSTVIGILSAFPLIYFFMVVGNFPVEQRYFYPLLPYLYFYAAMDVKAGTKLLSLAGNKIERIN